MSYTQRLANAAYGVTSFLAKQGFDVSGNGKKANDIMIAYLKSRNMKYSKWYKPNKHSLKTADMFNAARIQDDWADFRKFILHEYKDIG